MTVAEKQSDLKLRVARHRAGALESRLAHARRGLAAELYRSGGKVTPVAMELRIKIEELVPQLERALEDCRVESNRYGLTTAA